jgi:hypothetical protein
MGLSGDQDLKGRSEDAHESLCRRCGMSCHFAVPVNGLAVVIDDLRCKFLGKSEDGHYQCTVYERRFEVAPWCHTAERALAAGFLAQDCPYARGVPGYRGKVRLSRALLQKVLPALRAEVSRVGIPIGADPEAALAFISQAGGSWRYCASADGSRYLFQRLDTPDAVPVEADGALAEDTARRSSRLRVLS